MVHWITTDRFPAMYALVLKLSVPREAIMDKPIKSIRLPRLLLLHLTLFLVIKIPLPIPALASGTLANL